jgi:hypothetical protein
LLLTSCQARQEGDRGSEHTVRDTVPWAAAHGSASASTLDFDVTVGGGACGNLLPPEVDEQARLIVVTFAVLVRDGETCFGGGFSRRVEVRLKHPLGDRAVRDGTTGQVKPVEGRDATKTETGPTAPPATR